MRIVEYPHPSLLHATVPVSIVDKQLRLQVGEMFDLMYEAGGVGLAANQVALPFRLVVMNTDTQEKAKDREEIFINPVITGRRGTVEEEEGCLSFPGLFATVRRAKEVTVEAYNLQGELVRVECRGLESRAWQHEIDHLDGKVFLDRFPLLTKLAKKRDIKAFEERFRRAQSHGRIPATPEIQQALEKLRLDMTGRP